MKPEVKSPKSSAKGKMTPEVKENRGLAAPPATEGQGQIGGTNVNLQGNPNGTTAQHGPPGRSPDSNAVISQCQPLLDEQQLKRFQELYAQAPIGLRLYPGAQPICIGSLLVENNYSKTENLSLQKHLIMQDAWTQMAGVLRRRCGYKRCF